MWVLRHAWIIFISHPCWLFCIYNKNEYKEDMKYYMLFPESAHTCLHKILPWPCFLCPVIWKFARRWFFMDIQGRMPWWVPCMVILLNKGKWGHLIWIVWVSILLNCQMVIINLLYCKMGISVISTSLVFVISINITKSSPCYDGIANLKHVLIS